MRDRLLDRAVLFATKRKHSRRFQKTPNAWRYKAFEHESFKMTRQAVGECLSNGFLYLPLHERRIVIVPEPRQLSEGNTTEESESDAESAVSKRVVRVSLVSTGASNVTQSNPCTKPLPTPPPPGPALAILVPHETVVTTKPAPPCQRSRCPAPSATTTGNAPRASPVVRRDSFPRTERPSNENLSSLCKPPKARHGEHEFEDYSKYAPCVALYDLLKVAYPSLSGKFVGMFAEAHDASYLNHLIANPSALAAKVEEAIIVLTNAENQAKQLSVIPVVPPINDQIIPTRLAEDERPSISTSVSNQSTHPTNADSMLARPPDSNDSPHDGHPPAQPTLSLELAQGIGWKVVSKKKNRAKEPDAKMMADEVTVCATRHVQS